MDRSNKLSQSAGLWPALRMKNRKIEQGIFLSVALLGFLVFVFMTAGAYRTWCMTKINVLQGDYFQLFQVIGLTVLFGVAYWASRMKERREGLPKSSKA